MLSVKDVTTFIQGKKIIHDISLDIKPGEIVGLIGPNGTGKTTFMKTVLGLTKFTGSISIDKQRITENNHQALKKVGALIEHPAIYPFLTGRQNLLLYSESNKDLEEIISTLKMENFIDKKSKNYSLGMKQKLGIGIALLNNPELVILDEPMNGLDIESTIMIRDVIRKYANQGCMFLISSHILGELQKVMTQVVLLRSGKVILNRSMDLLNQDSSKKYYVQVDKKNLIENLLSRNNIDYQWVDNCLEIDSQDVKLMQDLIFQNGFYLNRLEPEKLNLEEKVIRILSDKEGSNNEE
ncbi:ATP-binding cassette domain-containing protein [Companilactobacillus musae]|uniref:ABC transporter ATP-binding protein n=1 Tax=Companilactobacillus musae TaxID=1903258 RepID=UPI000E64E008|nr:ATP-binding cassette domain-containing protein [Companilactobacillus musae]